MNMFWSSRKKTLLPSYFFLESVIRAENVDPIIALPPANVSTNISKGPLGFFLLSSKQSLELPID